ncbi:MAG: hypothetical protein OEO23_08800, partial [Gemmatimonadota bacterium]|nr:hypothetical protein [Gemmatimonadota bacterium]
VLDASGGTVRSYGRQGRGPGELSYPAGFGVTAEGRQVVADQGNGSLVTVDAQGVFAGSARVQEDAGFPTGRLIVMGDAVLAAPDPDVFPTAAVGDSMAWRLRAYHLGAPETRVWAEAWRAPEPPGTGEALTLGGRTMRVRVAGLTHLRSFWPRPILASVGNLVAVADSTTYRIRLYEQGGELLREVGRPIPPTPVTAAIEAAEKDRRKALIDAGQGSRFQISGSDGSSQGVDQDVVDAFVREQIDVMSFWREIPVVLGLVGGPDGILWVQRSGPNGRPGPIDLLDVEGRYLGTVSGDGGFPIALGPGGLAAYVETSDLGVTSIRVEVWLPQA